jgi:hypothetical protein
VELKESFFASVRVFHGQSSFLLGDFAEAVDERLWSGVVQLDQD